MTIARTTSLEINMFESRQEENVPERAILGRNIAEELLRAAEEPLELTRSH